MTGTVNPEDAMVALKTIIEADDAAKFVALDALYADSIVLDDIAKTWLATQVAHQEVPALVIVCPATRRLDEFGNNDIYEHDLVLEVTLRGNDTAVGFTGAEVLTKRLHRTVRGLHEIVEAKKQLTVDTTANADYVLFGDVSFSDVDDSDSNALQKSAVIDLTVRVSV